MNKEDFTEKLKFLNNDKEAIGLVLYFVTKSNDKFKVFQADIDRKTVEPKLRKQFLEYLQNEIVTNQDLNFADLSKADNRKDTVYFYDFEENPDGFNVIKAVIENEDQKLFDFTKDNLKEIFGFIAVIGNENKKVVLFKKHYPVNLIVRDSFFIFKDNTRLVNLDEEIIRISESFDFLIVEDTTLVLNLNTLEKYFGFRKVIRNRAKSNIDIIKNANILESVQLLEELSENTRFAKKLMRIKSNSEVFKLNFLKIRDFIRHHPKLKKRVKFNDSGSRISLDTKTSAELFLKLLDDDYLKSDLTDFLYETDTKNLLKLMEEGNNSQ